MYRCLNWLLCCAAVILWSNTVAIAQAGTDTTVVVLPQQTPVPADAKKIGTIRVGDNATAINCDYEGDINDAKDKARKMGGNLVKITRLLPPVFISKCYRIEADVYSSPSVAAYRAKAAGAQHSRNDSAATPYATLYVYRLKDSLALEPPYYLHLNNDSIICRIKSRMYKEVKIYDTGVITLWAKTDTRRELKLHLKAGAHYYLRCGLVRGEFILVPFMEIVPETEGAYEYGKLNKSNPPGTNVGLEYLREIH